MKKSQTKTFLILDADPKNLTITDQGMNWIENYPARKCDYFQIIPANQKEKIIQKK